MYPSAEARRDGVRGQYVRNTYGPAATESGRVFGPAFRYQAARRSYGCDGRRRRRGHRSSETHLRDEAVARRRSRSAGIVAVAARDQDASCEERTGFRLGPGTRRTVATLARRRVPELSSPTDASRL